MDDAIISFLVSLPGRYRQDRGLGGWWVVQVDNTWLLLLFTIDWSTYTATKQSS